MRQLLAVNIFCVFELFFITATAHDQVHGSNITSSCMENCSVKETDIESFPPFITEDKIAVLHSKCHSHCMNKVFVAVIIITIFNGFIIILIVTERS